LFPKKKDNGRISIYGIYCSIQLVSNEPQGSAFVKKLEMAWFEYGWHGRPVLHCR
jgi:hypothetical protein